MRILLVALALPAMAIAAATLGTPDLVVEEGVAMRSARAGHQATPLGGQVLITGGCARSSCEAIQASAELFDPVSGRFAPIAGMRDARVSHASAPIVDGGAIVAGGWNGTSTMTSIERYDRAARRFVPAAPLSTPRMDFTATALRGGEVLLAGGATATNRPTDVVERYDPASDRTRVTGAMHTPRAHHAAVRLNDGRVLIVGGLVARSTSTASAELFDPAAGRFTPTGALTQPRCKLAALLLKDGRVMVLAGSSDCNDRHRLATTEIYDPASGAFTPGPALLNPRYKIASAAAVLDSGEVIVAGDADDVELWRPGTDRFVQLRGGVAAGYAFSTATALPGGGVLIAGGYDADIVPTSRSWRVRFASAR
ncbi:kelch repeat-containing protein [Mitsuaria sp. GD03876]|uniref:Kelch repeat-containing protein n=1 Tax=Mitsuaria sp. GD03876 TaxID=2975399 RepID=UPI00244A82F6|nr:kelch repeat-containing protein [Mitsuaria sp. GD03876]MDH0866053.1 hypothetical protein [Mitsuaria sp. GD03876]